MGLQFHWGTALGLGLSALIALGAPPLAAWLFWRRTRAPLSAAAWGALVFFVSQPVLRIPWQVALQVYLNRIHALEGHPGRTAAWLLCSALTAGIFEEMGRYAGYRWLIRERSWRTGVMFGLGHGGIESILLVGLGLVANLGVYLWLTRGPTGTLPGVKPEDMAKVTAQFAKVTFPLALLGGIERLAALATHVGFSVIVLQGFTRGRPLRWVLAAIGAHALVDFVGPGTAMWLGPYIGEAVIAIMAICAVLLTLRFRTVLSPSNAEGAHGAVAT